MFQEGILCLYLTGWWTDRNMGGIIVLVRSQDAAVMWHALWKSGSQDLVSVTGVYTVLTFVFWATGASPGQSTLTYSALAWDKLGPAVGVHTVGFYFCFGVFIAISQEAYNYEQHVGDHDCFISTWPQIPAAITESHHVKRALFSMSVQYDESTDDDTVSYVQKHWTIPLLDHRVLPQAVHQTLLRRKSHTLQILC